ncbi:MAG: tRNA (adenosine(37)-N6)-threonylcarbamoyltransferase complex transferase subunit TsaD [Rhodospirillales bacterium 12-54-5]|nr:MAG: tRNA (adenosine(37)-N6)-threonylcarbamoyltransferase complex transferase subunit TsaD [Rhodospirillales bacterium 12-54-5]
MTQPSPRIVLGIESSCDETAVALVREDGTILAQALRTQTAEHAPYGGVVPEIAARAHLAHIDALYAQCLREAGVTLAEVDAIAVTAGPGLIGGVIVGLMFAKALAASSGKPLIAINHLEGHALTVRMTHGIAFPYFLLLVSGGHCQMLVVRGVGHYQLIGSTKDDALGEAFDKCAKMLGMPQPGGPAIEQAARYGHGQTYAFPRPMMGTDGCDFSFSGLKTAVRLVVEKERLAASPSDEELSSITIANIAASFQQAVFEVVGERVIRGLARAHLDHPKLTALAVAGGVAANQGLRMALESIAAAHNLPLVVAPPKLCTDNAAMIAWAGIERLKLGQVNDLTIAPRARWPLMELVG